MFYQCREWRAGPAALLLLVAAGGPTCLVEALNGLPSLLDGLKGSFGKLAHDNATVKSTDTNPQLAELYDWAQDGSLRPVQLRLWEGAPPFEHTGYITIDSADRCSKGDQADLPIVNMSEPAIILYLLPVDHPHRLTTTVVIAPGGGLRTLSFAQEGFEIAKWLNSIGINAAVVNYRVSITNRRTTRTTTQKSLADAQRAVSLVRYVAAIHLDLGLNPDRVGFMGFGSGAYLAMALGGAKKRVYWGARGGADRNNFRPDFVLSIYGGGGDQTESQHLHDVPPTFMAIALSDPCIDSESIIEDYAAINASSLNEVHVYSGSPDGYSDCSFFKKTGHQKPVCAWTVNAEAFMDRLYQTSTAPSLQSRSARFR